MTKPTGQSRGLGCLILLIIAAALVIISVTGGHSGTPGGVPSGSPASSEVIGSAVLSGPPSPVVPSSPAASALVPATTEAPPPPVTAPPRTSAPAACTPLTSGGNCYEPGERCRVSDHGVTGIAGNGEAITCEDNNGWRWESA